MTHRTSRFTRTTFLAALGMMVLPSSASGAELSIEGFYRARGRLYDTLSLDRGSQDTEGLSAYAQHRLWLRPQVLINDHVGVFFEVKGLDSVAWGTQNNPYFDPTTASDIPLTFSDDLSAPTSNTDGTMPLRDFTLWRGWGEIHSGNHRVKFGRMPLHWGAGVWQNDGLGLNSLYGDSADRVQWEGLFGDIYGSLAVDLNQGGFVNQLDGVTSFNGMAAYRSEQVVAGLNLQLRHTTNTPAGGRDLNVFTVDGALDAELGRLEIAAEVVAQFGSGDLDTGANDAQIAAGGGIIEGNLGTDVVDFGVIFGLATGDGNLGDNKVKTFTFDRDYDLGLILFEQPMPTLAAGVPNDSNGGRDYDSALTGNTISNAIFVRPMVGRDLSDSFRIEGSALMARTARIPETEEYDGRKGYGMEFDALVRYQGLEHLELEASGGVFLPGAYYRELDGFEYDDPVFGAQLTTRIRF